MSETNVVPTQPFAVEFEVGAEPAPHLRRGGFGRPSCAGSPRGAARMPPAFNPEPDRTA